MIFNRKTLSRLSVVFMLFTLNACSQLNNYFEAPTKANTEPEPELNQAPAQAAPVNTESLIVEAPAELTPEELILQGLRARTNSYAVTKRELSGHVKASMLHALRLFQQGELEQSSAVVTKVINNELNLSSSVYVLAGDIAFAQASDASNEQSKSTLHALALKHYKKAVSLNADNAKAANRLAKMMREQGEFEQALQLYTQAISAQAMHAPSYRNRAVLYDLYLNQKANALQDYQRYAALLQWQQTQAEQGLLVLTQAQKKSLKQDLKLVKRWLVDLERQVSAIAKNAEKAQSTNSGGD